MKIKSAIFGWQRQLRSAIYSRSQWCLFWRR